jgi:hypothetical protein
MAGMKVSKARPKEIAEMRQILREVGWLHKDFERADLESVDFREYEVFGRQIRVSDSEALMKDLVGYLDGLHHEKILMNLEVALDNCADPDEDVLEFNPNIKKGLELLQAWVDAEPGRRQEFPVLKVQHSELKRVGDSVHTSECPECTPGTLVMTRDPLDRTLYAEDACLFCGQRVVYGDVVDGKLVAAKQ